MTALETQIVNLLTMKIADMLKCFSQGTYFECCPIKHLTEMVKLAHQIRSFG